MNAVITPFEVKPEKLALNRNPPLESLHNEPVPREKQPGTSLVGSVLQGTILITFALGALTLLSFGLMPVVFVTLLLLIVPLAPVILLGLAIVFTEDMQQNGTADMSGQPCTCHRDRLVNTYHAPLRRQA